MPMTITAKVIEDSMWSGVRLTTMELRYPRFIHAEFMTHRMFSRNASSSRAIPVAKLIEDVERDPAMPIHWGKNQPGMQAHEEHDSRITHTHSDTGVISNKLAPTEAWLMARDNAVDMARAFHEAGYHKQIVNRLIEPFSHITVVVTATEWENFFKLRMSPNEVMDPTFPAQPEIQQLAIEMAVAMYNSTPTERKEHLPYVTLNEREAGHPLDYLAMLSSARCARTSYLTHERKPPHPDDDNILAQKLQSREHWSPFEHPARWQWGSSDYCWNANLRGWRSFRHQLGA